VALFPKDLQPWFRDVDLIAEGLVDYREACTFLGIGKSKLYDLVAAHEIPHVRIGKSLRFPKVGLKIFAVKGG
jgi:excisionase family DNA binding protein